jgi:hypothetical protein
MKWKATKYCCKSAVFRYVTRCALVRLFGGYIASIIGVTRIGKLGTKLAVTSNQTTLRSVPSKHRLLQNPHGVTSQKTVFFLVTAVKPKILHICLCLNVSR